MSGKKPDLDLKEGHAIDVLRRNGLDPKLDVSMEHSPDRRYWKVEIVAPAPVHAKIAGDILQAVLLDVQESAAYQKNSVGN